MEKPDPSRRQSPVGRNEVAGNFRTAWRLALVEVAARRVRAWVVLGAAVTLAWHAPARAQEAPEGPIAYTVRYADSRPGVLTVELHPGGVKLPQTLAMPRAIPMGYGQQPFDRFVQDLEAFAPGGRPLDVTAGSGPRWVIGGTAGTEGTVLEAVRYRVDLKRLETRSSRRPTRPRRASGTWGSWATPSSRTWKATRIVQPICVWKRRTAGRSS